MKTKISILFLASLTNLGFANAQNGISRNLPLNPIDSVLYYFKKSERVSSIDTTVFFKGIDLIYKNSFNPASVERIKTTAEDFRKRKNFYLSDQIYNTLRIKLEDMKQYDAEINFGKEIIDRYDANRNPDDRKRFLDFLMETRVPFNKSGRTEEGFAFYTPKLKLYLQRNDSAAISACYYVMGKFYRLKGFYDLAIYNIK